MPDVTAKGGVLLVLAIMLPVIGILLSLALGGRRAEQIFLLLMPAGLGAAAAIFATKCNSGHPLIYVVGGLQPPLCVPLRADGLSAVMTLVAASVICAVGIFARADFH